MMPISPLSTHLPLRFAAKIELGKPRVYRFGNHNGRLFELHRLAYPIPAKGLRELLRENNLNLRGDYLLLQDWNGRVCMVPDGDHSASEIEGQLAVVKEGPLWKRRYYLLSGPEYDTWKESNRPITWGESLVLLAQALQRRPPRPD